MIRALILPGSYAALGLRAGAYIAVPGAFALRRWPRWPLTPRPPVPESVTIPGDLALEAIALLNGYASLLADLRLDGEPEAFYAIQDTV